MHIKTTVHILWQHIGNLPMDTGRERQSVLKGKDNIMSTDQNRLL